MAGRRLAVGFLQIVPGVFPTGVVTDQLQKNLAKASLLCRKVAIPAYICWDFFYRYEINLPFHPPATQHNNSKGRPP